MVNPMILRQGMSGQDVAAWQAVLGDVPTTGFFGDQTDASTRRWQTAHGLTPDGIVGPATWAAAVGGVARVEGIDVSGAQSRIDVARVLAAGKLFTFVRANAGERQRDALFCRQAHDLASGGLLVGAYHYALADDDPRDDVDAFVAAIDAEKTELLLPPAVDVEITNGLTSSAVADWLWGWIERCRAVLGVTPLVYTGPAFWTNLGAAGVSREFEGCPLWVSNYGARTPMIPEPWKTPTFWQYAANTIWRMPDGSQAWGPKKPDPAATILARPGLVDGVEGEIDLDCFYGTLEDLRGLRAKLAA